jgi:hypothetical protein
MGGKGKVASRDSEGPSHGKPRSEPLHISCCRFRLQALLQQAFCPTEISVLKQLRQIAERSSEQHPIP